MPLPAPEIDNDVNGYVDLRRLKDRADIDRAVATALAHDPPLVIVMDDTQAAKVPAEKRKKERIRGKDLEVIPCVDHYRRVTEIDAQGNPTKMEPRDTKHIRLYIQKKEG